MSDGIDLSKISQATISSGGFKIPPNFSDYNLGGIGDEIANANRQLHLMQQNTIKEKAEKKQREIDTLETQQKILKIHGQQLETQQKSIELNELQLQFLQKIDGNTAILLNTIDELISSQYATEAYQSEMIDLLKEIKMDDSYLNTMKNKFKEVTIEKGVEYGLAFIINGIKLYIATRTGMHI